MIKLICLNDPERWLKHHLHVNIDELNPEKDHVFLGVEGLKGGGFFDLFKRWTIGEAIRDNKLNRLTKLLRKGESPNEKDEQGNAPLHIAVRYNNVRAAELLCLANASLQKKDANGFTPLHLAVSVKDIDFVRLFIQQESWLDSLNSQDDYPVHTAVRNGDLAILTLLIEGGADINAQNKHGLTPLALAVQLSMKSLVKALLTHHALVNVTSKNLNHPYHVVAITNDTEVADLLYKYNKGVNTKNKRRESPLIVALKNNNQKMITWLVKKGAELMASNPRESSALSIAEKNKDTSSLRCMITYSTWLGRGSNWWKVFQKLVRRNYVNSLNFLLKRRVQFSSFNQSDVDELCFYCARKGHLEVLKLLLDYSIADVQCVDHRKRTLLHHAAQGGCAVTAAWLIMNKVNIHSRDVKGDTSMHHAAHLGHIEVEELFLLLGASVVLPNQCGYSAMDYARKQGRMKFCKVFRKIEHQQKIEVSNDKIVSSLSQICNSVHSMNHKLTNNNRELRSLRLQMNAIQAILCGVDEKIDFSNQHLEEIVKDLKKNLKKNKKSSLAKKIFGIGLGLLKL